MKVAKILGRIIIDIYCSYDYEEGGLNCAKCFIGLDNNLVIDIPFNSDQDVWIKTLDPKAKSVFETESKKSFISLARDKNREVSLIKNRRIIDFIYYKESLDKGYFELENGYIISETTISPQGTGYEGLNSFKDIKDLESKKGVEYRRLSSL